MNIRHRCTSAHGYRLAKAGLLTAFFFFSCGGVNSAATADKPITYTDDDKVIAVGQQMPSSADWYKSSVFYHIWVRAWSDGVNNDCIGDIRGIINKLEYLNDGNPATATDLGINAIWLSPIFECAYKGDNMHGYDTVDYYAINNRFGKSSDVQELLAKAHARGIRVIFDFVPNHAADTSTWFASHPEYFKSSKTPLKWPMAWDSGNFSGTRWHKKGDRYYYSTNNLDWMLDLDYLKGWKGNTSPVLEEMKKVARYWLDRGFDGMRVDQARYIAENGAGAQADQPQTHAIMKQFRTVLDGYTAKGSGKMMVGEVWTDTMKVRDYYGTGNEFQMCFDFGLPYVIKDTVTDGDVDRYVDYIDYLESLEFPSPLGAFTVNHDNVVSRAATLYQSDDPSETRRKCILSAALNLFASGVPFVYYGEEIGMTGASGNDIDLRGDFAWNQAATQSKDDQSMLSWYRHLIRARLGNKAIREGTTTPVAGGNDYVVYMIKSAGAQKILIAMNLSSEAVNDSVDLSGISGLAAGSEVKPIIGSLGGVKALNGTMMNIHKMPAYGIRVILLQGDASLAAGDTATNIFTSDMQ